MVLFRSINDFADPQGPIGIPAARRRRLFIPPSTHFPLFSYGNGEDQRSFLSNIETTSNVADDEAVSDAASVSTSRSLPSSLSSVNTDHESLRSWLLDERQRTYSAAAAEDEHFHSDRRADLSRRYSDAKASVLDFATLRTAKSVELAVLARYALPLIVTFVLEHLFSIVSLLVVGHLGKNELAAVSLGTMTTTITFAVFEGIATALDTLCPQAYGAGNYQLVNLHVQRCLILSLAVYIPCALMWWYSATFLRFIIDSDDVLALTVLYLRVLVFGGPPYIFFEVCKRFLQCQSIFEAGTGILFLCAPINIALSWFLVWNKSVGLGFVGAPIATIINFWLMAFLLVLYVAFIDGDKCWFGLIKFNQVFHQLGHLVHLAIPGIVMLESEYFAYEIMTLIASYYGTVELAAQSAVSSIAALTYLIPFAISIAASTRIANFIGGQNIEGAAAARAVALSVGAGVAVLNCLVLFTFKRQIGRLFTSDEKVIELVTRLFDPLVAVIQIFDGTASVASGILRAEGLQKVGGIINFMAYYAFAIPLALAINKFYNLGLFGLWLGIGSGMLVIGFSEICVILNSDWEEVMAKAGLHLQYTDDEEEEPY